MAGTKRHWDGNPVSSDSNMADVQSNNNPDPAGTIQSLFTTFRSELDEHHDRRERVIKASRDITALSKKMCARSLTLPGNQRASSYLTTWLTSGPTASSPSSGTSPCAMHDLR